MASAFEATAREIRGVREAVGINEVHNFGKFLVKGSGACGWLDRGEKPRDGAVWDAWVMVR